MKVILLKDIPKIGKKYDIKDISDGYVRNSLLPKGLVEFATEERIEKIKTLKAETEAEKKIRYELLKKNMETINTMSITIARPTNDRGHLFSGIHKTDIVTELEKSHHLKIDPDSIDLPEPIKKIGNYTIPISIDEVTGSFTLEVMKE